MISQPDSRILIVDEVSKPTEQTSDAEDKYNSTDSEESSSDNMEGYEIHDSKPWKV